MALFCCGGSMPSCLMTATDYFRSLLGCGREDETLQEEDITIISGEPAAEERNLDNPQVRRGVVSKVDQLLAAGFEIEITLNSERS